MEVDPQYIIGDVFQVFLGTLAITYFMGSPPDAPVLKEGEPETILDITEEMLWAIAQLFATGICLGLAFLLVYFLLYIFRDCFNQQKGESAHRENLSTTATQLISIYPITLQIADAWYLIQRLYHVHGAKPIKKAFSDPDEVEVFYCIILTVYWICMSTAIFFFICSGFKIAKTVVNQIKRMLGYEVEDDKIEE